MRVGEIKVLNEGTLNFIKSSKGNSDWKASVSEKDTADYTGHDASLLYGVETEQTPKKHNKQPSIIQKDQITFTSEYVEQLGFKPKPKITKRKNSIPIRKDSIKDSIEAARNEMSSQPEELGERYVYLPDKATFVKVIPDTMVGSGAPSKPAILSPIKTADQPNRPT